MEEQKDSSPHSVDGDDRDDESVMDQVNERIKEFEESYRNSLNNLGQGYRDIVNNLEIKIESCKQDIDHERKSRIDSMDFYMKKIGYLKEDIDQERKNRLNDSDSYRKDLRDDISNLNQRLTLSYICIGVLGFTIAAIAYFK